MKTKIQNIMLYGLYLLVVLIVIVLILVFPFVYFRSLPLLNSNHYTEQYNEAQDLYSEGNYIEAFDIIDVLQTQHYHINENEYNEFKHKAIIQHMKIEIENENYDIALKYILQDTSEEAIRLTAECFEHIKGEY